MNKNTYIRSSFHPYRNNSNIGKIPVLDTFIQEYRTAVILSVNYIWDLKIEWKKDKIWDREKDLLDCPPMISTTSMNYKGPLSGRALKCAATKACGIIQAVVNKRKKDKNKVTWLKSHNRTPGKTLLKRINNGLTKPDCKNINCEINSICSDILFKDGKYFDGFIQLKCLWSKNSKYGRGLYVRVPLKHYRRSLQWRDKGKLMKSLEINESKISLRWEVPKPPKISKGKVIAIDQGKLDCLSTSDRQVFKKDIHGHTLYSIIDKLSKKKWGSKNFCKVASHRKNHINWCVKQLNLTDVKEIKLEDINNICYGRNVSRGMKHWTNTEIESSLCKLSEESGVLFTLEGSEYNSQRCSVCGWVQKANRKGKLFRCKKCGYESDADYNASRNILIRDTLFSLPYGFRRHRLNVRGFYWTSLGLFDDLGQELTVPVVPENEFSHI